MTAQERFIRIVRYLTVGGNQVFVDQINQPPIDHPRSGLFGQTFLKYLAVVMVLVAFAAILWMLAQ